MPLTISAGHVTLAGPREHNEDFVGMVTPDEPALSCKGIIAAIADGVSGNAGGREAAEFSVRGLLADYYATPDSWAVTQALERILKATNHWVQRQSAARPALAGMATTLTAIVLRGRFYYFSHVGDSRLYLLRSDILRCLTTDHVWDRPEMRHVLTRAIGLDSRLAIDHGMGELREGDVFLLATDGVWASMAEFELAARLTPLASGKVSADNAALTLANAALAAGSSDNASVLILRIDTLPAECLRDAVATSSRLPLPPKLRPGQRIDGYLVDEVIQASNSTLVYRVIDPKSQHKLALKTLHPDRAGHAHELAAFAHEEWLARRLVARFFPQVITSEEKHYLYYLTTWHEGRTLQQHLDAGAHFTVPDVVLHGMKLVRAVGALHRRSIIHRDIKPANVHLGSDGELRLLDFGIAQSEPDANEAANAPLAGTAPFLAPEQFEHAPPSRQTDLYSTGVTLYFMLTRRYPYGEIEPFQHPRFGPAALPSRYRPDVPLWLENVLLKAVARNPLERFKTAEEFLLALERGAVRPLHAPMAAPLANRNPIRWWRAIMMISVMLNLLLLYLLAAH